MADQEMPVWLKIILDLLPFVSGFGGFLVGTKTKVDVNGTQLASALEAVKDVQETVKDHGEMLQRHNITLDFIAQAWRESKEENRMIREELRQMNTNVATLLARSRHREDH